MHLRQCGSRPYLNGFFPLAPGPHPRRELTPMSRLRLLFASAAAWPQAPQAPPDSRDLPVPPGLPDPPAPPSPAGPHRRPFAQKRIHPFGGILEQGVARHRLAGDVVRDLDRAVDLIVKP